MRSMLPGNVAGGLADARGEPSLKITQAVTDAGATTFTESHERRSAADEASFIEPRFRARCEGGSFAHVQHAVWIFVERIGHVVSLR